MKRVCFILDHPLLEYRLPFFEILSNQGYTVTVFHSGKKRNVNFIEEIIVRRFRLFNILEYRMLPSLRRYEMVVHMQNLRIINLWLMSLNPFRSYKLIHWGIGTSSAKGLSSKKTLLSQVRNFLATCSSAQVLYSEYPLNLFSTRVRRKTFIAHNTIFNPELQNYSALKKEFILFIGSINSRKGLDILIDSFIRFYEKYNPMHLRKLVIVGDGPLKENFVNAYRKRVEDGVLEFTGSLNLEEQKRPLFKKAAVTVSLKQAGLSILESFSYGVPYIAFKDAISGGEILNIINGENGYLVENKDELISIFSKLDRCPVLVEELGNNAFNHYQKNRQMAYMVDVFCQADRFVSKN